MALLKFNLVEYRLELKGEDVFRGFDKNPRHRGLWAIVYWSYEYEAVCIITMINSWEMELGIHQADLIAACNNYIDYWLDIAVHTSHAKHGEHSHRIDSGKRLRDYFIQ